MDWKFNIFVVFLVILALELHEIDGRRGGGGIRGSSRTSGSRSRSSSSTSRTSSSVRYYRGPTYTKGSWKTAAAVGTVFGLMSYKRRSIYRSYPNREPSVCYNEKNLRNQTYGYFICPEEYDKDDKAYCCGDKNEQKCCTYTDKSAEGRVAGIVIGVVVACIVIGVIVYCVCIRRRRQQKQAKEGIVLATKPPVGGGSYIPEQQPLNPNVAGQQFPVQPGYGAQPPYNTPQAYDPNNPGLPYSANPGVPGVNPMPPPVEPGSYPPPQGPTSYPPPQDPMFEGQPPYAGAPPPVGFTGSEAYPDSKSGPYPPPTIGPEGYPVLPPGPEGYPVPPPGPEGYPVLPPGPEGYQQPPMGSEGYQQPPTGPEGYPQPAPGSQPFGYPPSTGVAPSAPPPSYDSTR